MKRFSRSLPYSWYQYLLVVLAAVLLWTAAFQIWHAPTPTESLYIFVGGHVPDNGFRDEMQARFAEDGVKLVHVASINPGDSAFATKYAAQGLNNCDVILVPRSVAEKTACEEAFAPPPDLFGCEGFEQEGRVYGICLPHSAKLALLRHFELTDEAYILFVSAASPNGGEGCATSNAWKTVEWLVNYV